jgi:hypothetical protein
MRSRLPASYGSTCAGAWFVLTGAASLVNFSFSGMGTLLSVLAVVAGVLLILGR